MGGEAAALDQDAQLMLHVKAGDADSFAILLGKYGAPVVRFLYRMVQNQGVAEELAQETFLRVYRSRNAYEPSAKFGTWLFRIASHLALNWLRDTKDEKCRQELDSGSGSVIQQIRAMDPSAEEWLLREAMLDEVRSAIAALPGNQRAAVLMHKYEEMSYSQIAKALDCSESAVKSLLFRAYETLRARLAHMER
jgi:RNA polymerase sigma-70 factor (ECF subfamily)